MELRESRRQTNPGGSSQPAIEVGDVVVVHDEGLPRGLGKVQEIRGATVKVSSNTRQHYVAVQLVYPLEVHSQ